MHRPPPLRACEGTVGRYCAGTIESDNKGRWGPGAPSRSDCARHIVPPESRNLTITSSWTYFGLSMEWTGTSARSAAESGRIPRAKARNLTTMKQFPLTSVRLATRKHQQILSYRDQARLSSEPREIPVPLGRNRLMPVATSRMTQSKPIRACRRLSPSRWRLAGFGAELPPGARGRSPSFA